MAKKLEKFPEGIEFKQIKRTVRVRTVLEPEERALTFLHSLHSYTVNSLFSFLGVVAGSASSAASGDSISLVIFWASMVLVIISSALLAFLFKAKKHMEDDD